MSEQNQPMTPVERPSSTVRIPADLSVARVTVLEDRAQVERRGTVTLREGMNRLVVSGVSPLIQDVSLQVQLDVDGSATARVVRSRRILPEQRHEAIAELEAESVALERRVQEGVDRFTRSSQRRARLLEMLLSAARELPEDASWGRGDADSWRHAFGRLFERTREEDRAALEAVLENGRLREDWEALQRRMRILHRTDTDLVAQAELDVVVSAAADAALTMAYIVPSAAWRPLHRAEWVGEDTGDGQLRWTPRAAVWQRTGEDWSDVELLLSTARTGSGTEPPLLSDDALTVRRKDEQVRVAVRDVEIQRVAPGGGGGPPEVPGVDDGGEARHLLVPGRVTVPGSGEPTFFDLEPLELPASGDVVAMPEIAQRALRRVRFTHTGAIPLLPGPVELVRRGGPFATTAVEFTASGARQELSFGPDDDLQVRRTADVVSDEVDRDDHWRRIQHRVRLYLSNTGAEARTLELVERIPVSEVAVVKIEGVEARPEAPADADGHVRWQLTVPPNGRATVRLVYTLATAPDVELGG